MALTSDSRGYTTADPPRRERRVPCLRILARQGASASSGRPHDGSRIAGIGMIGPPPRVLGEEGQCARFVSTAAKKKVVEDLGDDAIPGEYVTAQPFHDPVLRGMLGRAQIAEKKPVKHAVTVWVWDRAREGGAEFWRRRKTMLWRSISRADDRASAREENR